MKKLLFVFIALAVIVGNVSSHNSHSMKSGDDEREIPLFPSTSGEGGPVARGVITSPASAYINSNVITISFNQELPSASVSVSSTSDGVNVYSETIYSPEFITINLSSEDAGEYHLEIEAGDLRLSGSFAL